MRRVCVGGGCSYSGRWKAGKPHGKGFMQFNSEATYDGEWQDGVRHGKGVLEVKSGLRCVFAFVTRCVRPP